MQEDNSSCLVIPVGCRFVPTDEDLVLHYLYNRVMGYELPCYNVVRDCDLYGDKEPWEIWENFGGSLLNGNEDLFFFTQLKKKPNGSRIERRVGGNGGTWHGEDSGKKFEVQGIACTQKRFRYENSKSKNQDACWLMQEYSLDQSLTVLCRIRKSEKKRKSGDVKRQRKIHIDDDDNKPKRLKVEHALPGRQENRQIEATMIVGLPVMPTEFQQSLGDLKVSVNDDDDDGSLTQDSFMGKYYCSIDDFLADEAEIFGSENLTSSEVADFGTTSTLEQHYNGEDDDVNGLHSLVAGIFPDDASSILQESQIDFLPNKFYREDWVI